MAKGVTNQPLVIRVRREWYSRPEILALMRAGHTVKAVDEDSDLDLTRAAGWAVELLEPEKRENGELYWPYLDAGIARARARRRRK